jgi:hypothetical protein
VACEARRTSATQLDYLGYKTGYCILSKSGRDRGGRRHGRDGNYRGACRTCPQPGPELHKHEVQLICLCCRTCASGLGGEVLAERGSDARKWLASNTLLPLALALVTMLLAPAASASAQRMSHARAACRVPKLKGLSVAQARRRSARAHCKLRITGARLKNAAIQTVARQSPAASRRSATVTIWIEPLKEQRSNPLTSQPTAPTPVPGSSLCSVPNLTGLTVLQAEAGAARAGCKLRVEGAPLNDAGVQTVARQSPEAAQSAESVTVSVNPVCTASAEMPPTVSGPTPGPTGLVSGFYLDGGPLEVFSNPGCSRPEQPSGAGSVEVLNESGTLVATGTSEAGRPLEIRLPAGTYKLRATFLDAFINGVHPIETRSVEIPPGDSVRLDFVLQIP